MKESDRRARLQATQRSAAAVLLTLPEPVAVYVRRHSGDRQTATYHLSDLQRLHWGSVSGGIGKRTSHAALFGFVWCDDALDGAVAHSCRDDRPHLIKVGLPKDLNRDNWKKIAAIAPRS